VTDEPNQATDLLADAALPPAGQDQEQPRAVESEAAPVTVAPAAETTASEAEVAEPFPEQVVGEALGVDQPVLDQPAVDQPVAEQPPATPLADPAPAPPPPAKTKAPKKAKAKVEPELPAEPKSENMDWYILKVQSNREESIREGLLRRVAIAGLGTYFGDVIIPTEKVAEFRGGKKREIKRKLYPGYLVVQMEINEDTWFLVRETPGIGDFTGASGHPSPMLPHEVARIIAKKETPTGEAPKLRIGFSVGDRVKITEGTFENFEGEVENIDEASGRVTVMINIFGRSTPVELEYWQIEAV
jgi:transcription termination/antitermination protein NusG